MRNPRPVGFLLLFLIGLLSGCPPHSKRTSNRGNEATNEGDAVTTTKNRLAKTKSPYLLQHADNPVDWYPWGEEAFEKARQEDKPVFLSIGYSTCHWCHVMEHESFENEAVAAVLNEHFVSIKVDREERPDVDQIYMTACQMMTGQGGWPLTIFMTPDKRPFFAGTYFPPEDRFGRPGFKRLCETIAKTWRENREKLLDGAQEMTQALEQRQVAAREETDLTPDLYDRALAISRGRFDSQEGGFETPKFPRSHNLSMLLRVHRRRPEGEALKIVTRTLDAMRFGGIHDHVGGGFHRYATDREWLVPHFEKMLYDQGLLAWTYLEAYQMTDEEAYAETVRDIFRYVLRDLRHPDGAFYSAEDADSEGVEGKFYVWSPEELEEVLGTEVAETVARVYGVTEGGNFEETPGKSILHLTGPLSETADQLGIAPDELRSTLETAREKLLEARSKRVRPHLDDKILTAWNGLMIAALAQGGRILNEPSHVEAARTAADFLWENLRKEGRLQRRYREGEAGIPAYADDYAFFAFGLLELYEATFDPEILDRCQTLCRELLRLFQDESDGALFYTASDAEKLIVRTKEVYDGAEPSANSLGAWVLVRVGRLLGDKTLEGAGEEILQTYSSLVSRSPVAYPFLAMAFDVLHGPTREVVLVGEPEDAVVQKWLRALAGEFRPRTVVTLRPPGEPGPIGDLIPHLADKNEVEGKPTAYVCEGYACKQPVTTLEAFKKQLE